MWESFSQINLDVFFIPKNSYSVKMFASEASFENIWSKLPFLCKFWIVLTEQIAFVFGTGPWKLTYISGFRNFWYFVGRKGII